MIPDDFVAFFAAIVGVVGALIGLLFVAVSLAPRRLRDPATAHLAQAQASTALLVFTNTLTLGLFALMPHIDMGIVTLVIASIAMVYCVSVARVAMVRARIDPSSGRSMRRIAAGAFLLSGWEFWAGIELEIWPHRHAGVYTLTSTMIAAVLVGISRAWNLVGLTENSLFRSLRVLHDPSAADRAEGPEDPGQP